MNAFVGPREIIPSANRLFWVQAAAKVLDSGVTELTDLFGLNNLTQGSDAFEPAWAAHAGPFSRPLVVFDGSDDALIKTSASGPLTSSYDFYVLVRALTWVDNDKILQIGNFAGSAYSALRMRTGADRWEHVHDDGASVSATSTTGANDSNLHLIRAYVDDANDLCGISVDGEAPATTADTQTLGSKDRIDLGAAVSANHAHFDFLMAIGAQGALLTLAQRAAITRYANRVWAQSFTEPTV